MTGVPPAVGLLVAVGLILAVHRFAPEFFGAMLALLVLYLAATNVHRATSLFEAAPRALEALFGTTVVNRAYGSGPGGPAPA